MQLIFPSGLAYAVIKMDPLAMVKDLGLDDPVTLAAVQEMKPKKYLVYLEHPLDIPLPKSRWCRYSMSPLATTARAEKNGLLPDMVVPVFPNTQFSSEKRPPVVPQGPFPYSTCFHWIENVSNIRVRRRHDGELFDDARAVSLNGEQHVAMQMAFSDDYERVEELLSDDSEDNAPVAEDSIASQTSSVWSIPPDALTDPKVRQACSPLDPLWYPAADASTSAQHDGSSRRRVARRQARRDSVSSRNSSDTDSDSEMPQSIARDIAGLNLFGWDLDSTVPLMPLVDLWQELEEHICDEDDIPSPLDWDKEREEIVSIIMEAFARRSQSNNDVAVSTDSSSSKNEAPVAAPTPTSEPDRPATHMSAKADQSAPGSKHRWMVDKVKSGAGKLFSGTKHLAYAGRIGPQEEQNVIVTQA